MTERTIKEGDFAEIDFVGRIKNTGEIFDITMEEVAKKENIYDSKLRYRPAFLIVGEGMILEYLEQQIVGMKEGDEKTIDIKMNDAFGIRDALKIKVLPLSAFSKNEVEPAPGMYLEVDGNRCKVQSVGSGRVRADFNHPLAGKDVSYWVKIRRIFSTTEDKASAFLHHMGIECKASFSEGKLELRADMKLDGKLQKFLEEQLKERMSELNDIVFLESKKEGEQPAGENQKGQ